MYVEVNNNQFWVERKGKGPPLLLLHGFTGTTRTWESLIDEWARTFQVIAVDLPGHGKTMMKNKFTMESICYDIKGILNALHIPKVHILGYSMGGRTALSFACYNPLYVKTLILESASPGLKTASESQLRQEMDKKLAEKIEKEGVSSFVDYWEQIPLFQSQKRLSIEVQETVRKERLSQRKEGLIQSLLWMGTGAQPSWWSHLQQLTVSTLLIAGELDEKFVNLNKEMEKLLPNSTLSIVNNAGHAVHVEHPRKFGKIVSDFINNHEE